MLAAILIYVAPDFDAAFDIIDPPELTAIVWAVTQWNL